MPASLHYLSHRDRQHRIAALVIALLFAPLGWKLFGPRGEWVTVQSLRWQRDIVIERLVEVNDSSWCDEMPAGVQEVQRKLMDDPSGRRSEPSPHCRYTGLQWRELRSVRTEGLHPEPPHWGSPVLAGQRQEQAGAERIGKYKGIYEVLMVDDKARDWTCRLSLQQWQALKPEQQFRLFVDRFGVANCSTVPGPR
ncbi:MAG TPA: hypothetical protein VK195_20400 [Burkholderiaceae bacterium]|nr:hypothetical protein [Burkholderiaceae bacterium]